MLIIQDGVGSDFQGEGNATEDGILLHFLRKISTAVGNNLV